MDQYYQQPPQQVQPVAPVTPATTTSFLGLNVQDSQFWKGALLGAGIALLLTNEKVQAGVVKSVSQLTAAAQCGLEEVKEKFEDAKAEVEAEAKSSEAEA